MKYEIRDAHSLRNVSTIISTKLSAINALMNNPMNENEAIILKHELKDFKKSTQMYIDYIKNMYIDLLPQNSNQVKHQFKKGNKLRSPINPPLMKKQEEKVDNKIKDKIQDIIEDDEIEDIEDTEDSDDGMVEEEVVAEKKEESPKERLMRIRKERGLI